jgi:NTE family protein
LQAWLDAYLFDGQPLSALSGPDKPLVWINASDIFDNTPFVFDYETFGAICSDVSKLPISEAVAASAAVPIAFAPIVLQSYPSECAYERPAWLAAALQPNSAASANLQSFAQALENYRDPNIMRFIKLLDGGLVDNYGLAGLTLRREEAALPYAPLTPEQAVRLNRLLFVVVDAGQSENDSWVKKASGPDGADLISAAISTSMNSSKRASYDLFTAQMNSWHDDLVRFRCALPREEAARLGADTAHWNCRDVRFFVARLSFSLLDPPLAERLSRLPTSLSLPAADVDALIAGGGEALARAPAYRQFLKSLGEMGARISSVAPAAPPA